jgi:hypothetical protein
VGGPRRPPRHLRELRARQDADGLETVRLIGARRPTALIVAPLYVARQEFPAEAARARHPGEVHSTRRKRSTARTTARRSTSRTTRACARARSTSALFTSCIARRGLRPPRARHEDVPRVLPRLSDTPFKFVATATPAPNDYIEILNYAMFLGVMDIGEAKTRFFRRNSEKSDDLTLHPHKDGRVLAVGAHVGGLPAEAVGSRVLRRRLRAAAAHGELARVGVDHRTAGEERDGQQRCCRTPRSGSQEAAAAKRRSIPSASRRCASSSPSGPTITSSSGTISRTSAGARGRDPRRRRRVRLAGSRRARRIRRDFAHGRIQRLAAKPVMLGSGTATCSAIATGRSSPASASSSTTSSRRSTGSIGSCRRTRSRSTSCSRSPRPRSSRT